MEERGILMPLTYAMEGIVLDWYGHFDEWVWPLIDALDIISVNLYPMGVQEWYGWRDNLYLPKIWNIERSPIHVVFGLCDCFGILNLTT